MGVSEVVGAGKIVIVWGKVKSSGGVGRRGCAKQGGGIGTGRYYGPRMRAGVISNNLGH